MTQNLTSPVFLGTYTYTMVRLNSYRLLLLKSREINPIQQHDAPLYSRPSRLYRRVPLPAVLSRSRWCGPGGFGALSAPGTVPGSVRRGAHGRKDAGADTAIQGTECASRGRHQESASREKGEPTKNSSNGLSVKNTSARRIARTSSALSNDRPNNSSSLRRR